MSSICLAFICRQEAHVITKMLESCKPYIDYYIACDTGSTDRTVEIIQDVMKDVRGTVYRNEWKDFSTNRNLALASARASGCDYLLLMDCDDSLVVENPHWHQDLTAEVYDVKFQHGSISYFRPQLVRSAIPCRYVGVLHEYLELPAGTSNRELRGVHIAFGANGARSRNPNKFLDDVATFEKCMPLSCRDQFYYAQSLRDAGLHQQAIFAYKKCLDNPNQWIEEKYISALEMAKMYERLNRDDYETIEKLYLSAYLAIPTRAEALHYLALYYRLQNKFDKAYCFAKLGLNIRKHTGLFVENACAEYKLLDEFSVSAIYAGRKEEAKPVIEQMLRENLMPAHERLRIQNNLRFC
jgi:glycosyltransferase involved in cell wall biosynthesis